MLGVEINLINKDAIKREFDVLLKDLQKMATDNPIKFEGLDTISKITEQLTVLSKELKDLKNNSNIKLNISAGAIGKGGKNGIANPSDIVKNFTKEMVDEISDALKGISSYMDKVGQETTERMLVKEMKEDMDNVDKQIASYLNKAINMQTSDIREELKTRVPLWARNNKTGSKLDDIAKQMQDLFPHMFSYLANPSESILNWFDTYKGGKASTSKEIKNEVEHVTERYAQDLNLILLKLTEKFKKVLSPEEIEQFGKMSIEKKYDFLSKLQESYQRSIQKTTASNNANAEQLFRNIQKTEEELFKQIDYKINEEITRYSKFFRDNKIQVTQRNYKFDDEGEPYEESSVTTMDKTKLQLTAYKDLSKLQQELFRVEQQKIGATEKQVAVLEKVSRLIETQMGNINDMIKFYSLQNQELEASLDIEARKASIRLTLEADKQKTLAEENRQKLLYKDTKSALKEQYELETRLLGAKGTKKTKLQEELALVKSTVDLLKTNLNKDSLGKLLSTEENYKRDYNIAKASNVDKRADEKAKQDIYDANKAYKDMIKTLEKVYTLKERVASGKASKDEIDLISQYILKLEQRIKLLRENNRLTSEQEAKFSVKQSQLDVEANIKQQKKLDAEVAKQQQEAYKNLNSTLEEIYQKKAKILTADGEQKMALREQLKTLQASANTQIANINTNPQLRNMQEQVKVIENAKKLQSDYNVKLSAQGDIIQKNTSYAEAYIEKFLQKQLDNIEKLKARYDKLLNDKDVKPVFEEYKRQVQELGEVNLNAMDKGELTSYLSSFKQGLQGIQLQGDRVKTAILSANNAIRSSNPEISSWARQIKTAFEKFPIWLGASTVIMGAMHSLQQGFQAVVNLDQQMTMLKVSAQGTQEEFKQLSIDAQNFAKEYGTSVDNVMESLKVYTNMNESFTTLMDKTRASILLANLAEINTVESTDSLQALINQFALTDKEAMRVTDSLTKIGASLSLDFSRGVREISDGIKASGSVAKEAGFDLEQYEAVLGAIIEKTRLGGSQVGNALKTIMARIGQVKDPDISPDEMSKAEIALNAVGVSIRKVNGEFKDTPQILDDLSVVWARLTNVQKSYVAEATSGIRQKNIFMTMMNSWGQSTEYYTQALEANGFALERQEIFMDSISAKMQKLQATITTMWQQLIDNEEIKGFFDVIIGITESVSAIVTKMGSFGATMGVIFGVLTGYNKNFNAWQSMTAGAKGYTDSLKILNMYSKEAYAQANRSVPILTKISNGFIALGQTSLMASIKLGVAKVAMMGFNMAVGMGVGWAIATFISWISKLINRINEMRESVKEMATETQRVVSVNNESINYLKNIENEYATLASKTNKTLEEQNRFKDISAEIARISPNVVSGYDAQGNAVINLKNGVSDLVKELEKANELQQAMMLQKAPDAFKTMVHDMNDAYAQRNKIEANWAYQQNQVDTYKEMLVNPDISKAQKEEIEMQMTALMKEISAIQKKYANDLKVANGLIESAKKPFMDYLTLILQTDDSFKKLDETTKAVAMNLVKNFDFSAYKEGDIDKFKSDVENLLLILNNNKFKNTNVVKEIEELNNKAKQGDVEDYEQKIDVLIKKLVDFLTLQGIAIPNLQDIISGMFKIDFEQLDSDLTTMQTKFYTKVQECADIVGSLNEAIEDVSKNEQYNTKNIIELANTYPQLFSVMGDRKALELELIKIKNQQLSTTESVSKGEILIMKNALQEKGKIYGLELEALLAVTSTKEAFLESVLVKKATGTIGLESASKDLAVIYDYISAIKDADKFVKNLGANIGKVGLKTDSSKTSRNIYEPKDSKNTLSSQIKAYNDVYEAQKRHNDELERNIKLAEEQKDYNKALQLTKELIEGQGKAMTALQDAQIKMEEKANSLREDFLKKNSTSGFKALKSLNMTNKEESLNIIASWFGIDGNLHENFEEFIKKLEAERDAKAKELGLTDQSKVNSMTDAQYKANQSVIDSLNKEIEYVQDLANNISMLKQGWQDNSDTVLELTDGVKDLKQSYQDLEQERLNNLQEVEDKLIEAIKKRGELERDEIDKSFKAFEKSIQKQIDLIDSQYDQEDYENNLKEQNDELSKIDEQINAYKLDDSIEAKAKIIELEKQKAEILKKIADEQREKEKADRKKNLEDILAQEEEVTEKKKEEIDKQYTDAKIAEEVRLALHNGETEKLIEIYTNFENNFGQGMTTLGEKIKTEFIEKLKQASELVKQLGTDADGFLNTGGGTTNNSNDIGNNPLGMSRKDFATYLQNKKDWESGKRMEEASKQNADLRKRYGIPRDTYTYDQLKGYYAEGGIADYTGLAQVHGSKRSAEVWFNSAQAKKLYDYVVKLPHYSSTTSSIARPLIETLNNITFDKLINVEGNIDKNVLPDVEKAVAEGFKKLTSELNKGGMLRPVRV